MLTNAAAGDTSFWSEFSELEMDRYDDVNILSRSMTEISAGRNEVTSLQMGRLHRARRRLSTNFHQNSLTICRTKSPLREWCPLARWYSRLSRAVRDAAKSTGKQVETRPFRHAETELDNNIIQQISDLLVHAWSGNSVAHGIEIAGRPPRS